MRSVIATSFCFGWYGCFCDDQVGSAGSLTVVGDAAIRTPPATTAETSRLVNGNNNFRRGNVNVDPPNHVTDNINEDCVLRNAGVLSFPRGVSLTIAGGIEQTPTGVALVNLPPPLYLPFPGVSYEGQWPAERRVFWGQHPLVMESGATRLGGAVNASAWRGGGESERWVVRYGWYGARTLFLTVCDSTYYFGS